MRWAFNEIAESKYSTNQIRLKMNKMEGSNISSTSFYRSIKNLVYISKIYIKAYKDEQVFTVEAKQDSLISESLFNKVQNILSVKIFDERPQGKIIAANEFPVRGFLKCPRCGGHISGSGSKGKKNIYYYYHCKSKCGSRHSSNKVNSAFEKELEKYDYNEAINNVLKEIILRNFKPIQENIDNKKRELSMKMVNLTKRLDSAKEKYIEDRLDFEDYKIIKNESKIKIDELEIELQNQKLTYKNIDIRAKLEQELSILPNLSKLYLKGSNETKSSLLCSILAEKLEFQEKIFRTPKLNSSLSQIVLINNQSKK